MTIVYIYSPNPQAPVGREDLYTGINLSPVACNIYPAPVWLFVRFTLVLIRSPNPTPHYSNGIIPRCHIFTILFALRRLFHTYFSRKMPFRSCKLFISDWKSSRCGSKLSRCVRNASEMASSQNDVSVMPSVDHIWYYVIIAKSKYSNTMMMTDVLRPRLRTW